MDKIRNVSFEKFCNKCKYFSKRFYFFGFCAWWEREIENYGCCYQFTEKRGG